MLSRAAIAKLGLQWSSAATNMKGVHRLNTSRLQQTKQQRIHPSPSDVSSTFLPIAYVGCAVDIHISQKNHFLSLFCPAEFVYFLIKRAMPKSRLSLCIWIPSNSLEFLQVISSPPVSIIQVPVLMLNWEIKVYYIAMCTRGTSVLASDNLTSVKLTSNWQHCVRNSINKMKLDLRACAVLLLFAVGINGNILFDLRSFMCIYSWNSNEYILSPNQNLGCG